VPNHGITDIGQTFCRLCLTVVYSQGNRVKESACDEAGKEVVIPPGGLTLESH
jgi:hypothetical protein